MIEHAVYLLLTGSWAKLEYEFDAGTEGSCSSLLHPREDQRNNIYTWNDREHHDLSRTSYSGTNRNKGWSYLFWDGWREEEILSSQNFLIATVERAWSALHVFIQKESSVIIVKCFRKAQHKSFQWFWKKTPMFTKATYFKM